MKALGDRLDAMLPRVRVTELLHEVARGTGFLGAFTNFHKGEACPNANALLAAILADATNLGPQPGHRRHRLVELDLSRRRRAPATRLRRAAA